MQVSFMVSVVSPLKAALSLILLMSLSVSGHAESDSVADASGALVAQLQPLVTLSGQFSQRQSSSEGELLSESSGSFLMQRPGLLRWETLEPFPQLLTTDGTSLWMYDPDLEQVTVSRVSAQLTQTPAVIFSGDLAELKRQYQVSSTKANHYTLRPVDGDNNFQRLDLVFDAGLLKAMTILDGFGQTTEFDLEQVVRAESLPLERFQFEPPVGADVFFNE
ncbi:MAG: outer membrane lipoprotein carrier protein LolA [Cellvibrionaceae bacterium]|nr:outer membrane lipoprotein carrier protein LolA [Cellvibrionaceae bacterium]|tara:strand:+ start:10893 stop:11552 length:660 start_codon:yes stop_codon:yes gene_type:complete